MTKNMRRQGTQAGSLVPVAFFRSTNIFKRTQPGPDLNRTRHTLRAGAWLVSQSSERFNAQHRAQSGRDGTHQQPEITKD